MNPLKEAFDQKVHALALKTFSTSKWEAQKRKLSNDRKTNKGAK